MFSLIYASRENQPFTEADLQELAKQAAEKNRRLRVTGYLYYSEGSFFQYLEGSQRVVLELYDTISRDPRHTIANYLDLGMTSGRLFPAWDMQYLPPYAVERFSLEQVLQNTVEALTHPVFSREEAKLYAQRLLQELARREVADFTSN